MIIKVLRILLLLALILGGNAARVWWQERSERNQVKTILEGQGMTVDSVKNTMVLDGDKLVNCVLTYYTEANGQKHAINCIPENGNLRVLAQQPAIIPFNRAPIHP
jgi:hypothetical protein